jgi:hypothetical protein
MFVEMGQKYDEFANRFKDQIDTFSQGNICSR